MPIEQYPKAQFLRGHHKPILTTVEWGFATGRSRGRGHRPDCPKRARRGVRVPAEPTNFTKAICRWKSNAATG